MLPEPQKTEHTTKNEIVFLNIIKRKVRTSILEVFIMTLTEPCKDSEGRPPIRKRALVSIELCMHE